MACLARDAKQAREEILSPVLSALTVDNFDETIALAHGAVYGLADSIFIGHIKLSIFGARAIRAGKVMMNSFNKGDISPSFGGFKAFGYGGRGNRIHAHDPSCQVKTVSVDLADDFDEGVV